MAGRPTKYKPEFAEQAEKLCKLGHTDAELALFFEVDEATINRWKESHPEFCESIKAGKDLADSEVVESLYRRALGYSHESVKIFQSGNEPLVVPYTEHYPPDPTSMIFWLKNRQKKKWRDKIEQGFTDNEGNDVQIYIPQNGRSRSDQTSGRLSGESPKQLG